MSSSTGNWMLVAGALVAAAGLCMLPAGLGATGDRTILGMGASVFGFGALIMAGGFYLKAVAAKSVDGKSKEASVRPIRGGCDRCQVEAPVIQCKVHQQHLCGHCLAEHYDFRSCVYVPSPRRESATKARAARAK